MMYFTDEPLRDFERYDAEQQDMLFKLPKCSECGEHIQSDELYEFNDEFICPECLEHNHRKWVEDIVC